MRPLSQHAVTNRSPALKPHSRALPILVLLATVACAAGCGGGISAGVQSPPPPPTPAPSSISVTVNPATVSLLLGNTQTFSATVTGTTDTTVTWSINGNPGGSPATGSITAAGIYTAPQNLPALSVVTVTSQIVADPARQ